MAGNGQYGLVYPLDKNSINIDGSFSVKLPEGKYEIASAYTFMGNPWTGLTIADRSQSITVRIKAGKTTKAKGLLINALPAPDLNQEKGVLFNYDSSQKANVDQVIKTYMDYYKVPGASVVLVKDKKVVYYGVFGDKNSFTGEDVTGDTLFEGASITKAVFAFAVNRLAERGVIDLDKPLYEYLPFEAIAHDERYKKITGRHALSHQTGFPNWAWQNDDNQIDIKFYPGIKLVIQVKDLNIWAESFPT